MGSIYLSVFDNNIEFISSCFVSDLQKNDHVVCWCWIKFHKTEPVMRYFTVSWNCSEMVINLKTFLRNYPERATHIVSNVFISLPSIFAEAER